MGPKNTKLLVTNLLELTARQVIDIYQRRWGKSSRQRFETYQVRLKMGVLVSNLLHVIRQFYGWGKEVKRSMEWLTKRLIKVGARVSYHARRWYVHVALAFPLSHYYRVLLAWGP